MNTPENARLQAVFDDLQPTIEDLIIKHDVTQQEFQQAIAFLQDLAKADELMLASFFYFGWGVIMANEGRAYANPEKDGASTYVPTGPAYVPDAPLLERPYKLPMRPDEPGEPLLVSGQVRSTSGEPIVGAEIDIWTANSAGDYSNMTRELIQPMDFPLDESLPPFNLRGKILTDDEGRYEYWQVMPGIEWLGIREGGPLDGFFKKLGRVEARPLHIHAIVSAADFHPLTTQTHFSGDPFVGKTFDPRTTPESTVYDTQLHDDPADFKAHGLDTPYSTMTIDYVLRPAAPAV